MPLYSTINYSDDLKVFIWELKESHTELENKVILNSDFNTQYNSIGSEVKKREFLAGKFAIEEGCNHFEIPFNGILKDDYGKPYLSNSEWYISITHTLEYVAVVYSFKKSVGIDLEKPRQQLFRVLPRLFSEQEVLDVNNDLKMATIYWSIKEALYKLYGKRSVDFKENLQVIKNGECFEGVISMPDHYTRHLIYIQEIEDYVLIVAN